MKRIFHSITILSAVTITCLALFSFDHDAVTAYKGSFPYQKAGLTQRQAAAHLLNRFSFGATPGQVDEVVAAGLEKWFTRQLEGNGKDDSLEALLKDYPALRMSNTEIMQTYPRPGALLKKFSGKDGLPDSLDKGDKKDYRKEIKQYMDENNLKPQAELVRELVAQKILRAAYSRNQLKEVMTDFWFNHFNVSLTKNEDRNFIMAYERDVIRPNVTANFETLLLATAQSPAMLTYLDNFRSSVSSDAMNDRQQRVAKYQELMQQMNGKEAGMPPVNNKGKIIKPKTEGLNENYAREIMELHTLGVAGGYTQSDVTQAAKVLTGWTLYPGIALAKKGGMDEDRQRKAAQRMEKNGFVHRGDFLFAANKHDQSEKTVLGVTFPAGGGYEEGVKLIDLLAAHPSTARFISQKLAVRFVSDAPPQSLIDKMARTFLAKKGSIRDVLLTMVEAPEFWSKEALHEKTKSPFELAISSVRSLNAKITTPYQLYIWISKMGQKMYAYQAPTGFPDRGQYWINTGSLLNRMNFGLALAAGRIPGIYFSLPALTQNREPESAESALTVYSKILMPERNIDQTVKRLSPMLNDPELSKKIDAAAGNADKKEMGMAGDDMMMSNEGNTQDKKQAKVKEKAFKKNNTGMEVALQLRPGSNAMLAQVVGIIIGSPDYQRR